MDCSLCISVLSGYAARVYTDCILKGMLSDSEYSGSVLSNDIQEYVSEIVQHFLNGARVRS